ncbi:MAG: hypothetical protein GF317_21610|nr:hypothetical protein [Candidatus Lokiarchaeota archaeon]MBD3202059.1 hypothetical protein [Candidatus Lokiarchaeota archaeon]
MENRLLDQFNSVITSQWLVEEAQEPYDPLNHRELFEIAYHTANNLGTRCIFIKLIQDFKSGSNAILYSKNKMFTAIEAQEDTLKIGNYFNEDENANKLTETILPKIQKRKAKFSEMEKEERVQILKTLLVERKLDECANLVMLKDINRKIYFAIGDARESAAVVPLFMEAEGSSLVQLALNKWMATAQNLPPEETFPEERVPGLLKNLMQIKQWVLKLITSKLDK